MIQKLTLIADSGSTKTHWHVLEQQLNIWTDGINPFMQTEDEIRSLLQQQLMPHLNANVDSIYFYGAGCTPEKAPLVKQALYTLWPNTSTIEVESDLLGAARSLCGNQPGIACILGTGSNSCYFNGVNIEQQVSPLGFILGDEGSGAVLGKRWIGNLLKNQLPTRLKDEFLQEMNLTPADIIQKVYRESFPNRFLASFAPFIARHKNQEEVRRLVVDNFTQFFTRNVMNYPLHTQLPVHCIGSIAHYFHDELAQAASLCHLTLGKVEQSPMDGLVQYHLLNNKA